MISCSTTLAQGYVLGGGHLSFIRNEVLIGESPIFSWHGGGGINLYPLKACQKININVEVAFIEKGYNQNIGNQQFELRFRYLTSQLTISYSIIPFLSLKGGVNVARLFNTSMEKGLETYERIDVGLVGGLGYFENKRLGFYTRVVYGLSPMLKYYDIDSMGNFNDNIRDLKNTCFMVGLRFNVYDKKIHFTN